MTFLTKKSRHAYPHSQFASTLRYTASLLANTSFFSFQVNFTAVSPYSEPSNLPSYSPHDYFRKTKPLHHSSLPHLSLYTTFPVPVLSLQFPASLTDLYLHSLTHSGHRDEQLALSISTNSPRTVFEVCLSHLV